MRASGRSTLLTTRITGRRDSSALRSTNRVCGSGPSLASTSSSTPSTIVSPRSTSPPKSACPGVSTMLSFTPPWRTAVFLARIVMPFSRSRSIESITRSSTSWLARNAPLCHSMASTSVVLPWSTWAMMATLRRSSRLALMRRERVEESMARTTVEDLLAAARARLDRVGPEEAQAAVAAGAALIDIRSDEQRLRDGLVPDAHFIPRNVLEWRLDPASGFADPWIGGQFERHVILMCDEGYQ